MYEVNWVTVATHKGIEIQVSSPAPSDALEYRINHPHFKDRSVLLIDLACEAIDKELQ